MIVFLRCMWTGVKTEHGKVCQIDQRPELYRLLCI